MGKDRRTSQLSFSRLSREPADRHWLGEGVDGIESLVQEIDPFAFVVDSAICRRASFLANEVDGRERSPVAVLVAPPSQVSWYLGYLSSKFQTYLICDTMDPIVEAATEAFGVELCCGDLPAETEGNVDLFLYVGSCWKGVDDLVSALREALPYLSYDGEVGVTCACAATNGDLHLRWIHDSDLSVEEFFADSFARFSEPRVRVIEQVNRDVLPNVDQINSFLKRHRAFFGREARQLLDKWLRHSDFWEVVDGGSEPRFSLFASWGIADNPS